MDASSKELIQWLPKSNALVQWLANGERGISSDTIVQHLTGIQCSSTGLEGHPCDPADLGRCRKLLEQCPELIPLFPQMSTHSPEWAKFVESWDELCKLMDEEAPKWRVGEGSAPKTFSLMYKIRGIDTKSKML